MGARAPSAGSALWVRSLKRGAGGSGKALQRVFGVGRYLTAQNPKRASTGSRSRLGYRKAPWLGALCQFTGAARGSLQQLGGQWSAPAPSQRDLSTGVPRRGGGLRLPPIGRFCTERERAYFERSSPSVKGERPRYSGCSVDRRPCPATGDLVQEQETFASRPAYRLARSRSQNEGRGSVMSRLFRRVRHRAARKG